MHSKAILKRAEIDGNDAGERRRQVPLVLFRQRKHVNRMANGGAIAFERQYCIRSHLGTSAEIAGWNGYKLLTINTVADRKTLCGCAQPRLPQCLSRFYVKRSEGPVPITHKSDPSGGRH